MTLSLALKKQRQLDLYRVQVSLVYIASAKTTGETCHKKRKEEPGPYDNRWELRKE